MPKAVIFDVDGTLVDTNDLHASAWFDAFRHFGHDVPFPAIRAQMGKGGDQLVPVFLSGDDLKRDGERLKAYQADLFRRDYLPEAKPFPAVRDLFLRLKADRRRIVLASSGKADEIERHMRSAAIDDLVEAVTSADEVAHSKPAPDVFAAALDCLKPLTASEAVVVGDTPYDAEAAAQVGLRTVGLQCGGFGEDTLKRAGCMALFRDPRHLLRDYERSPLAG